LPLAHFHILKRDASLMCLVLATAALGAATPGIAQYAIAGLSKEVIGGTISLEETESAKFHTDLAPSRHLNSSNKPCLTVSGLIKAQIINANLYDQILLLDNQCSQPIKIRACYYKSTSCTVMQVNGYKREQHNLGVSTTGDFRYSYREYLN
jgi:hypothetical protein